MMPAAQLKMLRYVRNDQKGNPPGGGSPRAPATQPVPQHAPPPLANRQTLVDAAKLPVPVPSRYANTSQQASPTLVPALGQPPPRHQAIPQQRARASSDNGRIHAPSEREQQMWEDSTVNSMFADSIAGSTRQRPNQARYDSQLTQRQLHYDRNPRGRAPPELNPFVIGENGMLKVLSTPNGTTAATLNTSIQSRGLETPTRDDPYAQKAHYESPPKNPPSLKHAKYPFRDSRAIKRGSFSDRLSQHVDPDEINDASPSRLRKVTSGLDDRKSDFNNRSTIFHDIDTPLHRTPAPPEDDSSEAPSQGDEATNQRTPRQTRQAVSAPLLVAKKGLQESSLPRRGSRVDKATARKRRLSLDYDDHALDAMSYSDLKNEAFDYDPARVAIQAATSVPTGESLEDKIVYYKGKDENSQHHFFTQISVQEWETCGDWFLEHFSDVVQRMRTKRQTKRRMVAEFEAEIESREKTVRNKVNTIERTLDELKMDGVRMMEGRDPEV